VREDREENLYFLKKNGEEILPGCARQRDAALEINKIEKQKRNKSNSLKLWRCLFSYRDILSYSSLSFRELPCACAVLEAKTR
jgi:hypothetical protein